MGFLDEKAICRMCGNLFTPKSEKDCYCSEVCKMTYGFLNGGSDKAKPLKVKEQIAKVKRQMKAAKKGDSEKNKGGRIAEKTKFPRVMAMFELPLEKRWEISKTFNEEERKFCSKMMKRMLIEERRLDAVCSWDGEYEFRGTPSCWETSEPDKLGDSDDGTI